jgi:hypothetical protein
MNKINIILCEAGMTEYNGIEFKGICSHVYDITIENIDEIKKKINQDLDNAEQKEIEEKLKTQETVTLVRRKIGDEIIRLMGMEKDSYRIFSPTGETSQYIPNKKTGKGEMKPIQIAKTFGYESIIVY